jgi:hypothetical protein
MRYTPTLRLALFAAAVAAMVACGDPASPTSGAPKAVSFSVATAEQSPVSANRATFAVTTTSTPLIIAVGSDTLKIDSVRVVLAQVTLARTSVSCGVDGHDDSADSACANLKSGPFIVKLPLTAGALDLMDIPIPAGSYTRLSVRIHKPNSAETGPNVVAFLQAHPEWLNKSAMVDGTFNGVAFHWSHDPPIQLTHDFSPPLVINADGSNFTLRIDVGSWFKATSGALINPGAPTNVLYPQIASNVAKSFKLIKDVGKLGHDDGK